MSNGNKPHFPKLNLILLVPVFALICTPLFPFVNNGGHHIGIPNVCLWVMAWAIITTLILTVLFNREPELDEEIQEIFGKTAEELAAEAKAKGEVN
jgi:hypothetical protein